MHGPAQIVDRALSLPSPPRVMARLLGLVSDPDHDARQLAALVKLDPALVAVVLRVINSAANARRCGEIESIEQALVLLGEHELIRIAISQAAAVLRSGPLPGYDLAPSELWHKSVRTAIAAETIARRAGVVSPGIAYIAGLLVDVGKLALGSYLHARREQILTCLDESPPQSFATTELEVLGIDHAELGAVMAQSWDFPPRIVSAIRCHHRPSDAEPDHRPLAFVAHLADILSMMAGGAKVVDGLCYPMDPNTLAALALPEGPDELVVAIQDRVEASAELFDL